MKIYILDIRDIGGRRVISDFDKDKVVAKACEWFNEYFRFSDPASFSNIDDNMDKLVEGQVISFLDASLHLGESDLDLSGVTEVLCDAQHALCRNQELLDQLAKSAEHNVVEGLERAKSRYLATEQAIHLTLQKLKGQP